MFEVTQPLAMVDILFSSSESIKCVTYLRVFHHTPFVSVVQVDIEDLQCVHAYYEFLDRAAHDAQKYENNKNIYGALQTWKRALRILGAGR